MTPEEYEQQAKAEEAAAKTAQGVDKALHLEKAAQAHEKAAQKWEGDTTKDPDGSKGLKARQDALRDHQKAADEYQKESIKKANATPPDNASAAELLRRAARAHEEAARAADNLNDPQTKQLELGRAAWERSQAAEQFEKAGKHKEAGEEKEAQAKDHEKRAEAFGPGPGADDQIKKAKEARKKAAEQYEKAGEWARAAAAWEEAGEKDKAKEAQDKVPKKKRGEFSPEAHNVPIREDVSGRRERPVRK